MVTRQQAEQSLFVLVKDSITGRIMRIAVPCDMQVGLTGKPAELALLGRLSLSSAEYTIGARSGDIINISSAVTVCTVNVVTAPASNSVIVYLPPDARDGQLHVVKDGSGTAATTIITIRGTNNALIDGSSQKTIESAYGSVCFYWSGAQWRVFAEKTDASGGGSAVPTYVTLSNTGLLDNERRLNLSGSNITMVDAGPNSTVTLDLSTLIGSPGTYANATVTVDAKGRITAISAGAPAGTDADWTDGGHKLKTTSSVSIDGENRYVESIGTDVYFFVSGTVDVPSGTANARRIAVFGGDVRVSGSIDIGSGSVKVTSNDIQFGGFGTRIERQGADFKFFDTTNPSGYTLTQLAATSAGSGADVSASYVTIGTTGSLPNERALAVGTGLTLADGGAGASVTLAINDNVVATVTGTRFTGPVDAAGGLSGSLQRLSTGETYLVAGTNVTIVTQSNGQVVVNSTATGGGGGGSFWTDGVNRGKTTGSISIDSGNSYADEKGVDTYFYVSGTTGLQGAAARKSVFGGDILSSGTITALSGFSGSLTRLHDGTSYIVAGANITVASQSNGQVVISSAASPALPLINNITILAGIQNVNQTVFQDVAAFEFNPTGPETMAPSGSTSWTAYFQPIIEIFPTGTIAEARLFNVTSNEVVSNSLLTASSLTPTRLRTQNLTGSLSTGSNVYTMQMRLLVAASDRKAYCKGAKLFVTWN